MLHLLDLPDELLLAIIAACAEDRDPRHRLSSRSPGRKAILNFAKSCHRAFGLAEPWLYNTITLRKGVTDSDFLKGLQQRLFSQADRKRFIRDVALVPSSGNADLDLLDWASLVTELPKVEHVHIEVPFAQPDAVDDEETGDYMSPFWTSFRKSFALCTPNTRIPAWAFKLRTCHLNFSAPNGYSVQLGDVANVFAAPHIQRVSLVAADLSNFELDRKSIRPRSSPLKHLYLENCILSGEALRHIISIPKGLVSFTEYGGLTPNESTTHHHRLYSLIQALTQHKSTLTELSVNPRDLRSLSDFESSTSKTVSFAPLSYLSNLTIDFRDWRFDPGPTPFLERLPHRLKHLHLRVDLSQYAIHTSSDFKYWADYFAYWTNRIRRRTNRHRPLTCTFPRLKSFAAEMMHITPRVVKEEHRDTLETAAWRLKKESKVRMILYRRTKQRKAIPPYLWDEYEPELITMLDSNIMEKKSLWDVETPAEIEETKRLEKQWEINRMIELDQLRLDLRRQRLMKQIEKWEQEDMPAQEDLDAAAAAHKKEKERQAREALEVPGGLPIIPWDCSHALTELAGYSAADGWAPIADNAALSPASPEKAGDEGLIKAVDDAGTFLNLLNFLGNSSNGSSGLLKAASSQPPQSDLEDHKTLADAPHAEHIEQVVQPGPPSASANPADSKETTSEAAQKEQALISEISQMVEPSSNATTEPFLGTAEKAADGALNLIPSPTTKDSTTAPLTVPDSEADQKQRESKDKDKEPASKDGPTSPHDKLDAADGDTASVDADGEVEETTTPAAPGSSQKPSKTGSADPSVMVMGATASSAAKGSHSTVQVVAAG